jgi:hypothetical protein
MSQSTSVAGTIGATSNFFPGDTATINLLGQVPTSGKAPPDVPTFTEDTSGIVSVSAGTWTALSAGTPGGYSLPVTILAVAPGQTIVRALEDGVDDSPSSDLLVIVSTRPADTIAFDLTSVVITGN